MKRLYNNIKDRLSLLTANKSKNNEALRYLSNTDNHFFVNQGPAVKNLYELIYVMRDLTDEQFEFHVNENKNDFANWIADCISDYSLAADVRLLNDKYSTAIKIAERYMYLLNSAKIKK